MHLKEMVSPDFMLDLMQGYLTLGSILLHCEAVISNRVSNLIGKVSSCREGLCRIVAGLTRIPFGILILSIMNSLCFIYISLNSLLYNPTTDPYGKEESPLVRQDIC